MSQATEPDFADVIELERALMRSTTRGDRDALERILARDFMEIGKSGRLWSRAEIIDSLAHEGEQEQVHATDFVGTLVGPNLVLLTFVTTADGTRTRRSSLWRQGEDENWQIVFHQGTISQD